MEEVKVISKKYNDQDILQVNSEEAVNELVKLYAEAIIEGKIPEGLQIMRIASDQTSLTAEQISDLQSGYFALYIEDEQQNYYPFYDNDAGNVALIAIVELGLVRGFIGYILADVSMLSTSHNTIAYCKQTEKTIETGTKLYRHELRDSQNYIRCIAISTDNTPHEELTADFWTKLGNISQNVTVNSGTGYVPYAVLSVSTNMPNVIFSYVSGTTILTVSLMYTGYTDTVTPL